MRCRISSASMFALALSLLLIQATQASPADIGKKWGILGRWGIGECTAEKGRGDVVIYEVNKDGQFIYRRDDDPDDNNVVVEAHIDDRQRLVLQIYLTKLKQLRENAVEMEASGNIHSDYNRSAGGEAYTVRDGHFVANGKPVPSLHRCGRTTS